MAVSESNPVTPTLRQDDLKLLALITMLIDHIGLLFFPDQMAFRTIGRLAFPIFAWQLTEGFYHTKDVRKYRLRIFGFALLAQIPYAFMSPDMAFEPLRINILFQLYAGLWLLILMEKLKTSIVEIKNGKITVLPHTILPIGGIFLLLVLPDFLEVSIPGFQFSYGTYGQLLILIFYLGKNRFNRLIPMMMLLSLWHGIEVQLVDTLLPPDITWVGPSLLLSAWVNPDSLLQAFSVLLICLPTLDGVWFQARCLLVLPILYGRRGKPSPIRLNRWVAYGFYPVHMILLLLIHGAMLSIH